jgi:hypothetical protein
MHTLQGKPDTHDTYASRASPRTPLVRFLWAVPVRDNLSRSHQQSWTDPLLPRKRALVLIHNMLIDRSVGPYPVSLPQQPIKQWRKVKHLLATSYIGLLAPYLQHVINMFNTCSGGGGGTHRSLINTDGSYNLRGVGFLHQSLRSSQPMILHFPLMTLSSLKLTSST